MVPISMASIAGSQGHNHFYASALRNPMELYFRLNPGEFHRLQNVAIEIGTNVPLELFLGTPTLQIQDSPIVAFFLTDPASHAIGLSLDRALDRTQQTQHLSALILDRKYS